jgi:hypothetical protein
MLFADADCWSLGRPTNDSAKSSKSAMSSSPSETTTMSGCASVPCCF